MSGRLLLAVNALALVACQGPRDSGADGETGATVGAVETGASATGSSGSDEGAGAEASGSTVSPRLDVEDPTGAPEDGGDGGATTRCDKVDFLFVIDNSGSMKRYQDSLSAAFPGFIAAIRNTVTSVDGHHVMVVDSDAKPSRICDGDMACGGTLDKAVECMGYPCGKIDELSGCDIELGAGAVQSWGLNALQMECGFPSERRWLSTEDANLESAFACAAKQGTGGSGTEKPMLSMVAALDEARNAPGGCNDGFLREDALLVITVISDAARSGDNNLMQHFTAVEDWIDAAVTAKGGNPQNVVAMGLFPGTGCGDPTENYESFVAHFGEHGLVGNICLPDYASVFTQGVSVIDDACDDFVPPG